VKILITKFKSLGDVILLTPLIKNFKKAHPYARIDILLRNGTGQILANNPDIQEILTLGDHKSKLINFLYDAFIYLKVRLKKYDIVIATDRGERSSIVSKISKARIRIGRRNDFSPKLNKNFSHFFSFHGERHIIDLNLDPLKILDIGIESKGLEVFPQRADFDYVRNLIGDVTNFVQIHPVSKCKYKSIDDKLMARLIDYCEIDMGLRTIITGFGPNDETKVANILQHTKSSPVNLCSKLNIMQTAALNKMAVFILVVDTAIMHISTANEVPVIAFFGPTAVNNWGPWDKVLFDNSYTRKGGIQNHGMHTTISSNFKCIPCSQSGCNNTGLSDCLNMIEFDVVTNEIKKLLKDKSL